MAYEVIILGHLHMPLYFLETFTEYPQYRAQKSPQTLNRESADFFISAIYLSINA